jgi:deoxycytidylate deaminase
MKDDKYYMQRCHVLGERAAAKGNPPVGTIIIKGDEIISEAEEAGKSKNDITCHAEIEAIRIAVRKRNTNDLSDCILFTALLLASRQQCLTSREKNDKIKFPLFTGCWRKTPLQEFSKQTKKEKEM